MRSFIAPRRKKLMDDMSKLWLIFIFLVAAGLIGFGIYIHYKASIYTALLEKSSEENRQLSASVKDLKNDIQIISMQKELQDEVKKTNKILKESVKNLFDLVPDQITLTEVNMEKESLILKGYSISKETYTMLLQPPLKSIFDESLVTFSINSKGFYQFVSRNKMLTDKGHHDE